MFKEQSKRRSRLWAFFLVIVFVLIAFMQTQSPVYAADGTLSYSRGERLDYGSLFTDKMTIDGGNTAYCTEPSKIAPDEGTHSYTLLSQSSDVRKALYYLKGGYGYEKLTKSKYFSGYSEDNIYIIGHLALSYIYDGYNKSEDAFLGAPAALKSKAIAVADDIKSLPNPPASFKAFIFSVSGRQTIAGSWYKEPVGWIELQKKSAKEEIIVANSSYSLAGAKYGVYQGSTLITSLTTDAKGYAKSGKIEEGSYTVKEITASGGYALDVKGYNVAVVTDKTSALDVLEVPQSNPLELLLGKVDCETGKAAPQGSASLKDAEFTVKFYGLQSDTDPAKRGEKPLRTWVFKTDEKGKAYFSKDYLISGDDFYYQMDGKTVCLPLGTVTVQETKAPKGYLINDKVDVVKISADGTKESVATFNAPTSKEQVKRGDLQLVKVGDGTLKRLANVPFKITSVTTGESHIIITDKNGYADTSSSWNKHTENTNEGKTSEDGIWFGSATPDNSKGALIYDTYVIEELRCEANKGYKLLTIEVSIYKDSVTVPLGTLTNDMIEISTTAKDGEDSDKIVKIDSDITIVDTVRYKNLTEGKEYRLTGTLMSKETGKPIISGGKEVTAETVFTAKKSEGTVDVAFKFDGSTLKGGDVVVFEKLYTASGEIEVEIAAHEDITDAGQTVKLTKKEIVSTPKTGDDSNIWLWIALLAVAAATAGLAFWKGIKGKKDAKK